MKKILLVFLLTSGILSCFCDDVNPFWNVKDFSFEFLNDDGSFTTSDTVNLDTLSFIVDFDLDFVTENSLTQLFISTATATTCPEPGTDGMKNAISNITLMSNEDYNGITAGESLNSIVEHDGMEGFQSFLSKVESFPAVDYIGFYVVEKPANLDSLKFILQMDFDSGSSITKETGYIFWQ